MSNRIRELRIEKKITQLQLSIELNVTQETISAYEHNRHMPSVTALIKMSEIFNASMDYIMGLSNVRHILVEPDNTANDAEQKAKLLYCYQRLGTKNKARLIAYAEGLADSVKE
ncbi:MAG: helix-turn-helix domain-containing protein [Lachnospiraceae bacterium]|nr:helix-turn-helix domain-containing protein [Lachnospiraceae bacterium]